MSDIDFITQNVLELGERGFDTDRFQFLDLGDYP